MKRIAYLGIDVGGIAAKAGLVDGEIHLLAVAALAAVGISRAALADTSKRGQPCLSESS